MVAKLAGGAFVWHRSDVMKIGQRYCCQRGFKRLGIPIVAEEVGLCWKNYRAEHRNRYFKNKNS